VRLGVDVDVDVGDAVPVNVGDSVTVGSTSDVGDGLQAERSSRMRGIHLKTVRRGKIIFMGRPPYGS
jgi:hypothetical protein